MSTDLALHGKVRPRPGSQQARSYICQLSVESSSLKSCGLFLHWKEPLGRSYLAKTSLGEEEEEGRVS